jgi:hypothetical protein
MDLNQADLNFFNIWKPKLSEAKNISLKDIQEG